jgi:hypothetical protein
VSGAVALVLVRGLLPDVPLRPGAVVVGRVLDPQTLVLEGVRMAARLPSDVKPGERLRLQVQDASSDRLQLKVLERVAEPAPTEASAPAQAATAAPPPTVYPVALPGGAMAQVVVSEREAPRRGRPAEARAVVVRYDSPTLGRLDVRLDAGAAAVHVSAGDPADTVRDAAGVLREALARATGRPVQVTVHPREETLDVRA